MMTILLTVNIQIILSTALKNMSLDNNKVRKYNMQQKRGYKSKIIITTNNYYIRLSQTIHYTPNVYVRNIQLLRRVFISVNLRE